MIHQKAEEYVQRRIEGLFSHSDGLSEIQLKTLKAWHDYYRALPSNRGGSIKVTSVWNSLFRLKDLGKFLKKPFEDATKEDIIKFYDTQFIGKSIKSKSGSKVVVRQLYKWLGKEDVIDDPRLKPESIKNKITPKDMPTKEELERLLAGCPDARSKTILMLTYGEAGMRAGEIVTLTKDCVEFDQYGVKLWINKSKSNERYVRLCDTEPYLKRYLEYEYDLKGDPSELPLFYGLHKYNHEWLLPSAVNAIIKRAKRKSGIKKRFWAHGGRHASISRCHKLGMDVDTIAKRHGITAQTVRNTYLHFDDKDVDEAYLQMKGKMSKEDAETIREKQSFSPKKCPRCHHINPHDARYTNKSISSSSRQSRCS